MPSGKQILLSEITRLSQTKLTEQELEAATERIKAGLLLHGSTADSAWPTVEKFAWIEKEPGIQGPGLANDDIYLADLVNALKSENDIPTVIKDSYPELSLKNYRAGLHIIWLLLSQLYYQDSLSVVENDGNFDEDAAEKMISAHIEKLQIYRKNPKEFLGRPIEQAEDEI
ncbi:hypothetical protein Rhal01_03325 [Rubritalea halochordaticola]|uniref:Uncharacterized protein n=1 Tax=Rubritalea halochordaticola TaxID=714537 RepID=A0ABP9V582_9BACT